MRETKDKVAASDRRVSVTLPADVKAGLEEWAQADGNRSVSSLARRILMDAVLQRHPAARTKGGR